MARITKTKIYKGLKMKNAMMEKRITLNDLSGKTGIGFTRLSELKSGRAEPTGDEVDKIAMVLGNKIRFAGMDESDENMRQLEVIMEGMDAAYKEIRGRGYKKGNGTPKDSMDCPVCGKTLYFRVAECNGHVHAKCETDSCLAWME